tara:strand:+ start:2720 stop:3328 length:609 start_codon:yes stop_codon:yes gene_type:complete
MVTIIDYGMGNLGSVRNMLRKIGVNSVISSNLSKIENAEKLILPGVGLYSKAMDNLKSMGADRIIKNKVIEGTPLLGICLGMQLLSSHSEEGNVKGLDIIPGNVKKFKLDSNFKIPHMGWNSIYYNNESVLFDGFDKFEEVRFYFVHSYYYDLTENKNQIAYAKYADDFTCAIQLNKVFGVQFHPEKSHKFGIQLLKNFCKI